MKNLFKDFDKDIADNLKEQLMILWTHNSTAIEGNTLSLGETSFVIREGLTIGGKSLKDHEEVVGFFEAAKFLEKLADKEIISKEDIFKIHKMTMLNPDIDINKPVGAWKKEPNGTYHQNDTGTTIWVEYPLPKAIPSMMEEWLELFNQMTPVKSTRELIKNYSILHVSFASIHPFYDGNGRVARLLANIPVIRSGMPPITINSERRREYIKLMSGFSVEDKLKLKGDMDIFEDFVEGNYKEVFKLIEDAKEQQKKRSSV